jgi:uncharacterized protein involved in response to NO
MTLAIMTRATLGHTGRRLEASLGTQVIYAAVIIAALSRICAVLAPQHNGPLLAVAGAAWAVAFLGFAACYAEALWTHRQPIPPQPVTSPAPNLARVIKQ